MLILTELCLTALVVPLAFLAPRLGKRWFTAIEGRVSRLAARRGLAVLAIFVLALATRLAVLPIEPVPVPGVQDEFGYLLSADTFAHGRLTNPTHPMWVHFESMTIIQQPTYSSAFYPAQGFFLAIGQVLLKHPFWGVWLSTGLMCGAICWGLQGWMPPGWAFLGGVLAILRLGTFTYWANSYWGGSVAAIGGALVFGALPRIKRRQRIRHAVLMGVGLAILANSRPFEGLFYSVLLLIALAIFVFRSKFLPLRVAMRRIILPLAIVMALTFAFMGYYFWRTTGNPLRPPYLVDVATYMQDPLFIWQSLRAAPSYHHPVMQEVYGSFHVQMFIGAKQAPVITIFRKVFYFWLFFIGPAITLPFFVLGGVLPYGMSVRDFGSKAQFLTVLIFVSFCGLLLPAFFNPHYAAPMVCVTYALILQAMRRVRIWDRHGRSKGVFVIRAAVATCFIVFFSAAFGLALGISRERLFLFDPDRENSARAQIIHTLGHEDGKHLIVVRYRPGHDIHDEWVYNDADIDASKVVWAREMTPPEDENLLAYFKDRRVWLLEADQQPARLFPYSDQAAGRGMP